MDVPARSGASDGALGRGGLIDLSLFDLLEFGLGDANGAVVRAASSAGPLRLTVLRPDKAR